MQFLTDLLPLIINITILIGLIIVYKILSRFLNIQKLKIGVSPSSINAVILLIRIIFIAVGVSITLSILTSSYLNVFIDPAWFISASALIGTAVGLATAQSLSNIIAGFYILFTRPFHVNDYVKIGNVEGLVEEVSMNRTRLRAPDGTVLLIPNNQILNSTLINYRLNRLEAEKILAESEEESSSRKLTDQLVELIKSHKPIYKYSFELPIRVDWNLSNVKKAISKICGEWESIFHYKPVYEFTATDFSKNVFTISLITDNAELILEKKNSFLEALTSEIQRSVGVQSL